jgi:hypothetical protein
MVPVGLSGQGSAVLSEQEGWVGTAVAQHRVWEGTFLFESAPSDTFLLAPDLTEDEDEAVLVDSMPHPFLQSVVAPPLMQDIERPRLMRITQLGPNINTLYSELTPIRHGDKIYFASQKETPDGGMANRIYSVVRNYPAREIVENTDSDMFQVSDITISPDGKRMYYTICEKEPLTNELICKIFYRERLYEGNWSVPKHLPKHINRDPYTSTHPTVGYDKFLQKDVLFFASDRPGGTGGMDIWCSIIGRDGSYGMPYPLPFNTTVDDITPFFHQASQTLFFSSNGMECVGGFDIFRTQKTGIGEWTIPYNPGRPLNSPNDDFHFTLHAGSKRGYFASNRPGTFCTDDNFECKWTDIYEAQIPVNLIVRVFDGRDSSQLDGAKLSLVDRSDNSVDTVLYRESTNQFVLPLKLGRNYHVLLEKDSFVSEPVALSTEAVTFPVNFERSAFLWRGDSIPAPVEQEPVLAVVEPNIPLPEERKRIGILSADGNAIDEQKLLKTADRTVLTALKQILAIDTATVRVLQAGPSDEQANLPPLYVGPLVLYFDNNQPRQGSTAESRHYGNEYEAFISRKSVYMKGYAVGLAAEDVTAARKLIQAFFDEEVSDNYQKLQVLCRNLQAYVSAGKRVVIHLTGRASPVAQDAYNEKLTRRRILSIMDFISQYDNHALKKAIADGQVSFRENTVGENLPESRFVSDDAKDRRKSVYSPEACILRSVSIDAITIDEL